MKIPKHQFSTIGIIAVLLFFVIAATWAFVVSNWIIGVVAIILLAAASIYLIGGRKTTG